MGEHDPSRPGQYLTDVQARIRRGRRLATELGDILVLEDDVHHVYLVHARSEAGNHVAKVRVTVERI